VSTAVALSSYGELEAIGGEAIPVSLELVGIKDRVGTIADHAGAANYGVRTLGGVRTAGRLEELVESCTREAGCEFASRTPIPSATHPGRTRRSKPDTSAGK
jgi:enoyl reductase